MTGAMILATPTIAGHAALKAQSVGQFLHAFVQAASWPLVTSGGTALAAVCAIIIQAPAALTCLHIIRQRPALSDRRWLLLALSAWGVLQIAALAYGRADSPFAPRYLDTFTIVLLVDFACLLLFLDGSDGNRQRRAFAGSLLAFWLLMIAGGATMELKRALPELAKVLSDGRARTENLRAFLDTGDIKTLENKPFLHIPYPDAKSLAVIASQPAVRALLPPALVGTASATRAQQRGLARFTGRPLEAFKDAMLRWGILLTPVGIVLFLLGFMAQRRRAVPPTSSS